ncbi:MAG: hypothetical protein QW703_01980 [Candidatus Aenigmatarchaeota archaeon]
MPELTWELMFGFLALVFIALLFLIISGLGGGLQQFNIFGCEESPPPWKFWCMAGEEVDKDYFIARQSFDALACAINAVATGNPNHPCLSSFKPTKQAGFALAAEQGQASVECKEKAIGEYYFTIRAKSIENAEDECKKLCGPDCYVEAIKEGEIYNCTHVSIECTVKNFNLPENFSGFGLAKAKEYIAGFGDPSFLVYFQSFPVGEDETWNGWSPWYETIGKWIFVGMCVGHLIKPFVKLASYSSNPVKVLAATSTKATKILQRLRDLGVTEKALDEAYIFAVAEGRVTTSKEFSQLLATNILNNKVVNKWDWAHYLNRIYSSGKVERGTDLAKKISDAYTKVKTGGVSDINLLKYLPEEDIKTIIGETIPADKKISTLDAIAKTMAFVGIDSFGAYLASRIDSEIDKFFDSPGNLILDRALKKSDEVVIEGPKMPMVLNKPEWFNGVTPFYLASPCQADINIKIKEALCNFHINNSVTGLVICDGLREKGWKEKIDEIRTLFGGKEIKKCGSLLEWSNPYDEVPYERLSTLIKRGVKTKWFNVHTETDFYCIKETFLGDGGEKIFWIGKDLYNDVEMGDPGYVKSIEFVDESQCGEKPEKIDYIQIFDLINYATYYYDPLQKAIIVYEHTTEKIEKILTYDGCNIIDSLTEIENASGYEAPIMKCEVARRIDSKHILVTTIYINLSDGKPENVFSIATKYDLMTGYFAIITVDDDNSDGKIDSLKYLIWKNIPNFEVLDITIFDDVNYDGVLTDVVTTTNCQTDAIFIEPDMSPYKNKEPNYCYKKSYESALNLVFITGSFGLSAICKAAKLGGPEMWVLTTAVDCGLAIAQFYVEPKWPGG